MRKRTHNKKECCCLCAHQYVAEVCNCFNEWPKEAFITVSDINHFHGSIGWACTAMAFEGVVDIMRSKHGACECFTKRKKNGEA